MHRLLSERIIKIDSQARQDIPVAARGINFTITTSNLLSQNGVRSMNGNKELVRDPPYTHL